MRMPATRLTRARRLRSFRKRSGLEDDKHLRTRQAERQLEPLSQEALTPHSELNIGVRFLQFLADLHAAWLIRLGPGDEDSENAVAEFRLDTLRVWSHRQCDDEIKRTGDPFAPMHAALLVIVDGFGARDTNRVVFGLDVQVVLCNAGQFDNGDEVVPLADAEKLAARIIAAIKTPQQVLGHHLEIGASIGIAIVPKHGVNPEELMANVDQALYRAKSMGRACYVLFEGGPIEAKRQQAKAVTT